MTEGQPPAPGGSPDWKTRAKRYEVPHDFKPEDTVTVAEAEDLLANALGDLLAANEKNDALEAALDAANARYERDMREHNAKLAVYKGYFLGNPMTKESFEEWKRLKKPSYEELEAQLAAAEAELALADRINKEVNESAIANIKANEELRAKLAAAVAANNDWRKAWDEQKARIAALEEKEARAVLALVEGGKRIAALEAARDKALETAEEFRVERDKARAKLAAARKALEENLEQQNDRGRELGARIAELEAENEALLDKGASDAIAIAALQDELRRLRGADGC
jgi:hypothetical protein